ncbi:hypothetical protein AB0E69_14560 [Kribbella sp. NPDC026611]|uniref:hypothetical protein n=1 Tax=Kribbella sp. NPDC026611 TaxID=3154911 RepID=UPI003411B5E7
MRPNNGRLIALVAAVAVAAIATGGALAYRQGPHNGSEAEAAPLTGSPTPVPPTTTPKPSLTPSATPVKTPTAPPSGTPSDKPSGTGKSQVVLTKLPTGRTPQVPYLSGRTVKGGAGQDVKIPGSQEIQEVARLNQSVLAVLSTADNGSELLKLDGFNGSRRTPNVSQVVSTEDGMAAAYLTTVTSDTGEQEKGTTIYAERSTVQKVNVPDVWNAYLLGYLSGKVYFRATATEGSSTWTLYEWTPGSSKVSAIKSVPKVTAVSSNGELAASLTAVTDYSTCSSMLSLSAGKRLWRTCDYMIDGFTLDGATAIAGPFYRDGYGDGLAAVLDAKTGTLLHEWKGVFRQAVPEDDQHLLLLADTGEETPASIIRCTMTTGACELATPLAKGTLLLGS